MPRGGKRKGTVGGMYPNRSDMRSPALANQPSTYGDKAQQQRAVQAVPLPKPQGSALPSARGAPAPAPPIPGASPFDRPTERPGEPVTAGLPIGAGPGPSVATPAIDAVVETLRAAVARFPTPGALALLEALDPSYRQ